MKADPGGVGRWAFETFGAAKLGDERRGARLVAMASAAAARPAGPITQVFDRAAEREGAFRLLENDAVEPQAVADASFAATARACGEQSLIFVPIDGSSLTLTDRSGKRELGRVGNTLVKSRGLQVMSALAVDADGVVVGVLDQEWWARTNPPADRTRSMKCLNGSHLRKETRYWLDVLSRCDERLSRHGAQVTAWYQLDRGADCWPVFRLSLERKLLMTVRARHDRRLLRPDGHVTHLREELERQPILGKFEIELPERPNRSARKAKLSVRACTVTIHARTKSKHREAFTLNAVLAQEVGGRRGEKPLHWLLLTTHPVGTFDEALAVIRGYTRRWRIEEFHRAWKRGHCNVESSQLHGRNAIVKWATILAAVAARAVRLAQLARTAAPEALAETEFSEHEIEAAFLYVKRKRPRKQQVLLREIVDIIADVGGFAHKYSGKQPGATVLARGLERIEILAMGLKNQSEMR